jgi:hypothetical protein
VFEIHLCLLLRDALDVAFQGGACGGPEWLDNWGRSMVALIRRAYPDQPDARTAVWQRTRDVLWDLAGTHSCDELSRHILLHPDTFLSTVLMLGAPKHSKVETRPSDPPTLH